MFAERHRDLVYGLLGVESPCLPLSSASFEGAPLRASSEDDTRSLRRARKREMLHLHATIYVACVRAQMVTELLELPAVVALDLQ